MIAALAGPLQGCTSPMEERARFLDGWRPGRIVQIDAGAAINVSLARDCREEVTPEAAARNRYALVRYSEAPSRYRYRIAPLHSAAAWRVGDRVEVNIGNCQLPLMEGR